MEANFWIKISAKKRYSRWEPGPVQAFKTKPTTDERSVAIKFSLEIPDEVFEEPVFEAKISIPKTVRKFPEMVEVASYLGQELSKQTGFKVKLDIPTEPVEAK